MTLLRYRFRSDIVASLEASAVYYKVRQEFPIDASLLGELVLDSFRFPTKGGLYWSAPDFAFPECEVMALVRPSLQKPTEASRRLLLEDSMVLVETVKATSGYQYPFIVIENQDYVEVMGDDGLVNFVTKDEFMEVLAELRS